MVIKTEYINPPIPIRQFDWLAYDEDNCEKGCPAGYGKTREEAIENLKQIIEEEE